MRAETERNEQLPKARVIHVSQMQPGDVYIGRTCYGYQDQGWGNPFKLNS